MLMPPTKLRGDLLSLADMGMDSRSFARASGLSFDAILAQDPISHGKLAEIYDHIGAAVSDDVTLQCGRSIKLQHLGLLGYRLSNCATVGSILADWIEYCGHIGYPLIATLEIMGGSWRMHFHARYPLPIEAEKFCVTSTLAGFAQSLFNLSGHPIRLGRIGFPGPRRGSKAVLADLGADEVLFGQPVPFVEGQRADLDRKILTADTQLLTMFDALFRQSWTHSNSLAERLHNLLQTKGPLDLRQASELLGLSARSLQRHLASEGQVFSVILDRFRHARALQLLDQGRQSKWIAHELGFEDSSSFRRSFKRWTGEALPACRRSRENARGTAPMQRSKGQEALVASF